MKRQQGKPVVVFILLDDDVSVGQFVVVVHQFEISQELLGQRDTTRAVSEVAQLPDFSCHTPAGHPLNIQSMDLITFNPVFQLDSCLT